MGRNGSKNGFLNNSFEYFVCIFQQMSKIDKFEAL